MSSRLTTKNMRRSFTLALLLQVAALILLTGCLEQYQSTRLPSGALVDFLLHLQNGELDDARTYFAPGLVTPSAALDQSLLDASNTIKKYEIRKRKATGEDIANGERRETLSGQVRLRTPPGQPTPGPEDGWTDTDIITARIVERGPGWRLLDFKLLCCGQ